MIESKLLRSKDLTRTMFQVVALAGLIAGSLWIIRPFLAAILWAATIAIATWPVLLQVQSWLGGKRSLAIGLMTTMLLLILVAPIYFAVSTIADNTQQVANWSKSIATLRIPPAPAWLAELPVVGTRAAIRWKQLAAASPEEISAYVSPLVRTVGLWFVGQVGNLALLLGQFVITVAITAIMFANGEAAGQSVERFAARLAGREGEKAVQLAVQTIRGVALGIVLTALLQSVLAGIGLACAGVPYASFLTAVTFVVATAQVPPLIVLFGPIIWVYWQSGAIWGTGLLLWTVFCSVFDNFLRPVLVKRSANIPIALVFLGVIGGLIAFGVIGLFVGPMVLAVGQTLLSDWIWESGTAAVSDQAPTASEDVVFSPGTATREL